MSIAVTATAAAFFFRGDLGGLPFGIIVAAAVVWFALLGHGLIYSPLLWLRALLEIAAYPFRRRDADRPKNDS